MTYPVRYGGDLGNRIFVLYWRCPLIRVSVIRGSTVVWKDVYCIYLTYERDEWWVIVDKVMKFLVS